MSKLYKAVRKTDLYLPVICPRLLCNGKLDWEQGVPDYYSTCPECGIEATITLPEELT